MAEIKKKNLVLVFSTPAGGEVKLTINSPKEGLTTAQVNAAMNAIIDAKALGEAQIVSSKAEAKYIIQEVEAIEMQE